MAKYLYGRNILITGAGSGIGLASAELFASQGYCVWGVSRSCEESDKQFGDGEIRMRRMDVTDEASIRKVVKEIDDEVQDLGIVLHCAGFGIAGPAEDTPIDMIRKQIETNYFGVVKVNSEILPIFRRNEKGLVLVMGSVAGIISIPFQSHYASSKFALEAYVEALRLECAPYGIRAALIEPGDTKTGFTDSRRICSSDSSVYNARCVKAVNQMEKDEQKGKSPKTAARVAYALSEKSNPPIRKIVGFDYKTLVLLKRILPSRLVEMVLKKIYLS